MKYILIIHLLIFTLTIISCKERNIKNNDENHPKDKVIIEVSTDTIHLGEYIKGIVSLKASDLDKENSKTVIVLQADENHQLKKDLSNEYQIPIEIFQSLENDSLNQKWFNNKDYNYKKSVVFGKKFTETGNRKIRGYVLEYLTEKPPLDSIYPKNKVRKYYFEKDIFVLNNYSIDKQNSG